MNILILTSCNSDDLVDNEKNNPHEHAYVEGKCSCGEVDPNYIPPHVHEYIEGVCSCGEKDPNYIPPHVHEFIDGKCNCGEIDPNYEELPVKEELEFKLSKDGTYYILTGLGTCTDTKIVIPSEYEGLPVTTIGASAFSECTSLTSIEIPDSVTSIENYAFEGCKNLISVEIPNSVDSLGKSAFARCTNLSKIKLSEKIITIETMTFISCGKLTEIVIPSSITEIGTDAFLASGIEKIINNSSLSLEIGSNKHGCIAKNAILIEGNNGDKSYIDNETKEVIVIKDNFKFTKYSDTYQLVEYVGQQDTVTFPVDIFEQTYVMCDIRGVENVIIPEGITKIDMCAFSGCETLKSIKIPSTVTIIDYGAFTNCKNLEEIIIADNSKLTEIGVIAFQNCEKLKNINIPKGVNKIGQQAFYNCNQLEKIVIPGSVEIIEYLAFEKCFNITIYCEVASKPNGGDERIFINYCPIIWNYQNE